MCSAIASESCNRPWCRSKWFPAGASVPGTLHVRSSPSFAFEVFQDTRNVPARSPRTDETNLQHVSSCPAGGRHQCPTLASCLHSLLGMYCCSIGDCMMRPCTHVSTFSLEESGRHGNYLGQGVARIGQLVFRPRMRTWRANGMMVGQVFGRERHGSHIRKSKAPSSSGKLKRSTSVLYSSWCL